MIGQHGIPVFEPESLPPKPSRNTLFLADT